MPTEVPTEVPRSAWRRWPAAVEREQDDRPTSLLHTQGFAYFGIADGMSIARGWACRYSKWLLFVGDAEIGKTSVFFIFILVLGPAAEPTALLFLNVRLWIQSEEKNYDHPKARTASRPV